ncbi:hypothetical protein CN491_09835 [Bacillus cereus]|uniref:Uncharacterized protein n=1 Tax=Bacillus cereus TaxID=1396 RepID=A0A2B2GBN7_BACCE|nr:hypothetical protein CN491_09835 [Bacillus cereus]PFP79452.1 hypothetical protein COJ95_10635 [Bacillus cereus]PGT20886.1 hypothetical protein COC96_02870 [Bacillus cereus]
MIIIIIWILEPKGITMKTMFTFCSVPNIDLSKVINNYKIFSFLRKNCNELFEKGGENNG